MVNLRLVFVACISLIVVSCGPHFLYIFDDQPIVTVTYRPTENEVQFDTRNMIIHTDGSCRPLPCHIIMQAVVLAKGQKPEELEPYRAVLRFRALSYEPRFQTNRFLRFELKGEEYGGECASTEVFQSGHYLVEGFQINVDGEVLRLLAAADTVRGSIGSITLSITRPYLAPINSLVDTVKLIDTIKIVE